MRLWTIHPKYMDRMGLLALWREGLLARKVLEGKTKGYRYHPELNSFKSHSSPAVAVNTYLLHVWKEGCRRGYDFDRTKIWGTQTREIIRIDKKEIECELKILRSKLWKRDREKHRELRNVRRPDLNPLFRYMQNR